MKTHVFSFLRNIFIVLGHILLTNELMLMFTKTAKDLFLVCVHSFDHMVL